MTRIKALWTGGSLVTRTLLHVATFVIGSLVVVSVMSVALVSTAKGLLSARGGAATAASCWKRRWIFAGQRVISA